MEPSEHRGLGVFGPAYRQMYERWPVAPASVDDVLYRQMVLLTSNSAPDLYRPPEPSRYEKGSRPQLEPFVKGATEAAMDEEVKVRGIARTVGQWSRDFEESPASSDYDNYRFGGVEEDILARGADNCAEVARVACALFQVAGLPARIGLLADTDKAYSGHVVCEVFFKGAWGAVDARTDVVYRHPDGRPASLWEVHRSPELVLTHTGPDHAYSTPGQFRAVAITAYDIADASRYDYTESPINDYVREIWRMSNAGWPGGLRWLFSEDEAPA